MDYDGTWSLWVRGFRGPRLGHDELLGCQGPLICSFPGPGVELSNSTHQAMSLAEEDIELPSGPVDSKNQVRGQHVGTHM